MVRGQLPSVRVQLTSAGGTSVMGQVRFVLAVKGRPEPEDDEDDKMGKGKAPANGGNGAGPADGAEPAAPTEVDATV